MPRKLSRDFIKNQFDKYGYTLPPDFEYRNNSTKYRVYDEINARYVNITYKQLQYRIRNQTRQEYTYPTPFDNMPLPENEFKPNTSFARWMEKRKDDEFMRNLDEEQKQTIFESFKKSMKNLMKKKAFTTYFDDKNNMEQMKGFIEACKVSGPNITNQRIRLTLTDSDDKENYRYLSSDTINFLDTLFNTDEFDYSVRDSLNDMINSILDIKRIDVEFEQIKEGKRTVAEFFPFINKSDIDLKRYGIFANENEDEFNEPCLIQAFKNSSLLTDNEMNMLKNFVKTRAVPQTTLNDISKLLKIHIHCKKYYEEKDKTSHVDFGTEYKDKRSINLIIIDNHYVLNEITNVSECYIKRYAEINEDKRFKNHSRKMMLLKFDDKRYSFGKRGLKILKLIKLMIENKLLVKMSDKDINKYSWSFKPSNNLNFNSYRPVFIDDKKDSLYKQMNRVKQTQYFFGYKPDPEEVNERLKEVQEVIDSLNLRKHINVKLYYKFSELMQKIMYEYGCYDNVYELCGEEAKRIRDECIFPKIKTFNEKSFYSNEKLYYIDLNGAYMAAVSNIPTGKINDKGEFEGNNGKIKELINILYEKRMKAKEEGKDKLAKTLKFMMNSCWGYSIKRPKSIKHKFTKNVNSYIDAFAPFVIGYNFNEDGVSGFVDTVNSFVPHFTIPHFARSVLNEFKRMIDEVKKIVNVYYENIDAILINESDYYKLVKLGYVGDKLGQFKIEHIFTEIAIKSTKRYVATLENGEKYYHCVKDNVDYEEFIKDVKNSI